MRWFVHEMMLFWPTSRILVRSGAWLAVGYIDPDPSGQCQGNKGATSIIGTVSPVVERKILGPKSRTSGIMDARNTLAKRRQ
jgi:hypothetical protein